jgi:4-hydroxybenzoyl-CoA thioesterase/acyl-CoA thioester hydrolase
MGGIVHFSRFFVFMETAEHRFLESLGSSVVGQLEGRAVGWPRVAASCEYRSPARFGDELEIVVRVRRKGRTSLTYACSFLRDGVEIAAGRMVAVCCVLDGGAVRPIPIPEPIAGAVEPLAE